jgi:hypothetical protein
MQESWSTCRNLNLKLRPASGHLNLLQGWKASTYAVAPYWEMFYSTYSVPWTSRKAQLEGRRGKVVRITSAAPRSTGSCHWQ